MPSTDQFSRPSAGMMSSGSIRTRITAALDLAIWRSTPSSGSPSSSPSKIAVRLGVDQVADLEVGRPDRACRRRRGRRACPSSQIVCSRPAPGYVGFVGRPGVVRAEVAQQHDGGQAEQADRAEQRVADQRAPADAGLLEADAEACEGGLAVLVGGRGGVAVLDDLLVGHQLAGPLDDADADEQQGAGQAQAEREVRGAEAADDVRVVADLEARSTRPRTGPCRPRTARTGRRPGARPASRPSGRRRSDASGAREARVGDQARRCAGQVLVRRLVVARAWSLVVVAHASTFFLFERVVWAAIQTATPTSRPMPTSQANRPSLTGPRPPRPKPP